MASNTFAGGRAKLYVGESLVGFFDSCNYTVSHGAQPVHILGRFSPAEIAVTSYEAVTVNVSGFRVVGHGAFVLPKVPKLQDIINLESIVLTLVDRKTGQKIMTVQNCVAINYSSGSNAKDISRIQITYLGTNLSEEDGDQDEGDATTLI